MAQNSLKLDFFKKCIYTLAAMWVKVSEESEMARFWVNYKDSIDMDYKYDAKVSHPQKSLVK
jgi:hypothetical protein